MKASRIARASNQIKQEGPLRRSFFMSLPALHCSMDSTLPPLRGGANCVTFYLTKSYCGNSRKTAAERERKMKQRRSSIELLRFLAAAIVMIFVITLLFSFAVMSIRERKGEIR